MNPEDEALREFESAANKTAIARQHAMEAAERTCLGLRIEIQQLTKERDRLGNITDIQQKQIERMMDARDAEKVRADKAEAAWKHCDFEFPDGTICNCPMQDEGEYGYRCPVCSMRERADKAEAELKSAAQREDALRRELIGHREKAQGNYWAWQGDNDHLETLVRHCPVLIQAKDLQEIISKREKAYAEMRTYLELARHKFIQTHASNLDQLQTMPTPYDHALSLDCGRGHIPASELDKTIELLSEIEQSPGPYWIAVRTRNEITRLEALRKEAR